MLGSSWERAKEVGPGGGIPHHSLPFIDLSALRKPSTKPAETAQAPCDDG